MGLFIGSVEENLLKYQGNGLVKRLTLKQLEKENPKMVNVASLRGSVNDEQT